MLPARRPTTPRCFGPTSFSSIEWHAAQAWYSVLPCTASPALGFVAGAAGCPTAAIEMPASARNVAAARAKPRTRRSLVFMPVLLLGDRRVGERERAARSRDRHRRDAEHRAQLFGRDLEWPRPRALADRGLRIRRRARGVEGDVPFDLLHDLVDVAVQD